MGTAGLLGAGDDGVGAGGQRQDGPAADPPIRVNAISPGTIDTGAYDGLGDQAKAALIAARRERNPARPIGTDDVAAAVVFARTTTFMTGVSLGIDGGEPLV